MASNNFIKFQDFNIKNLRLCEGKINKKFGYQTMAIKYAYPDGEERGLRLHSPSLFSYGVCQFEDKNADYFMPVRSFYDAENPTEKEIGFKKVLDSISEFLRKEVVEKSALIKKKQDDTFDELEIANNNIFFLKLNRDKTINKSGKVTNCEITTIFYETNEKGNLVKIKDINPLRKVNCKLVAYIDIEDIFTAPSIAKIRCSISEAIIIKRSVDPPKSIAKSFTPSTEVTLGSDDEE